MGFIGVISLHPLQHLKELHIDDDTRGEPDLEWPMSWSSLIRVTALTCSALTKLPELVSVMTNIHSLDVEYTHADNQSQPDRLRIQNLTRLTSLKISEGDYV